MADAQTLILGCTGLQADPGPFVAGQGALIEATNVSFRRPGVIEPRVPFLLTFDSGITSGDCYQVASYFDGSSTSTYWAGTSTGSSILRRDATATLSGGFTFTRDKTHFCAASGRGFLTTDQGVAVVDGNSAASLRLAGVPRGPGFYTYVTASASGWLASGYVVGYRTVVARSLNGTIARGAPSEVRYVGNGASFIVTGLQYVNLRIYITPDIVAGDTIELYRLPVIAGTVNGYGLDGYPADEGKLRCSIYVTASDVSTGYIDFADWASDTQWTGAYLYTNASQEGILLGNERPNYARDVALYNGMTFYAAQQSPQRVTLQCAAVGLPNDVNTLWVSGTDMSRRICGGTVSASITSGSNVLTLTSAASDLQYLAVSQYITIGTATTDNPESGNASLAANTQIVSIDSGAGTAVMSTNALATGAVFVRLYDWIEVDDGVTKRRIYTCGDNNTATMPRANILTTFTNFFTGRNEWNGYYGGATGTAYSGGSADMERAWAASFGTATFRLAAVYGSDKNNEVVSIRVERTDASLGSFTVRSSKPLAFDRYVDSVTGVTSAQEGAPGQLAWSKLSEPEAVPLPYFNVLGDKSRPIHRIAATRDALYIFKSDGIWRCFGDDPESLTFQLIDVSAGLSDNAPNMVTTFGADVYAWTGRGIVRVNGGGVSDIDGPISRLAVGALGPGGYAANTFALSSTQGSWVAFGMSATSTGQNQNLLWVYHPDLGTWSQWTFRRTVTAGFSDGMSSLIGYASGSGQPCDYDFVESASYAPNNGDLLDGRWTATKATNRITISAGTAWTPAVGDAIGSQPSPAIVTNVVSATVFDVNDGSLVSGSNAVWENNTSKVTWVANSASSPAQVKHYVDSHLLFSRLRRGSSMLLKWTGYRNATQQTVTDTYDSTYAAFAAARPYQSRIHVPAGCGRDWALKVGFEFAQASCWFTCDGCALTYVVTGNKV